jgi:hypothetical protein
VPSKFIDSIDKEQAAIASIDSLPNEGDLTLVAAAKGGDLQAFEVLVERHTQGMGLGEVFFSLPAIVKSGRSRSCALHPTQPVRGRSPRGLRRGRETAHRSFGRLTIDGGSICFIEKGNASKCQSPRKDGWSPRSSRKTWNEAYDPVLQNEAAGYYSTL